MVTIRYWNGDANVAEMEGTLLEETHGFLRIRRSDRVEVRLGRAWIIEILEAAR